MKRFLDITVSFFLLFLLAPLMIFVAILVKTTSKGPIIYWSNRVGKDNEIFRMPKFRTMYLDAPIIATNLLVNAKKFITPLGFFLRKTSIDELPQLWIVLIGAMSLVGPRPALFNQYDLIALRVECGVHKLKPGITGWAQINGRDELSIQNKVNFDFEYLNKFSLWFDIKILFLTILKVFSIKDVSH
jgi:O-antigen biosynthesis protein WbqP